MQKKKSWKPDVWIKFTIKISFVIILFLSALFMGTVIQNENLIKQEILARAQSHFNQIVLTRRWNASHGEVLVEKKHGIVSNPYLDDPDIRGCDGKIYTKKNPALMTREISALSQQNGMLALNITSLRPLNPANQPDDFEKEALMLFEKGEKEIYKEITKNSSSFFRYMAPLYVEENCLQCHARQNYKLGDIRGGISITFNINDIKKTMNRQRVILILLGITTAILLLGIIYFMIKSIMGKLSEAYRMIENQAITDELTGLYNRRHILKVLNEEFDRSQRYNTPLSCVMIDIDYFKPINDTYGHLSGDSVLRHLSEWMRFNCRKSDIAGRYGGEEFLIIIPDEKKSSEAVAEKIRAYIENRKIEFDTGKTVSMTVSIGVSSLHGKNDAIENYEKLLKLADDALYRAKREGRNRVVSAE